jgi:hypothetical protein
MSALLSKGDAPVNICFRAFYLVVESENESYSKPDTAQAGVIAVH